MPLSQGIFLMMIGSLEIMHKLILATTRVIQIRSTNSIRLRFNLVKSQLNRKKNFKHVAEMYEAQEERNV